MKNMLENYKLTIMKELSVEEKAKRYDEAIKRASNLHKDAVEMENNMTTKTCEIIFPELKESDEKVREDIISLVNVFWERIGSINPEYSSRSRMIAWLEKQGKQKSSLPKWKYKKDNTPLLRDSLVLNKYGCVLKALSGAIISDAWVLDYTELAELPREEPEKQGKMLDADKVIEWLDKHAPTKFEDMQNYVNQFKKDFRL